MKPIDITDDASEFTTKDGELAFLPNELIASTQQLLQALEVDTNIDPRSDDEIA